MRGLLALAIVALLALAACTPASVSPTSPTHTTGATATATAVPTSTPYPTYTPYPTHTPYPTPTPTPTPRPTPVPTPTPQNIDLAYITVNTTYYTDDADPEYEGMTVVVDCYNSKSELILFAGLPILVDVKVFSRDRYVYDKQVTITDVRELSMSGKTLRIPYPVLFQGSDTSSSTAFFQATFKVVLTVLDHSVSGKTVIQQYIYDSRPVTKFEYDQLMWLRQRGLPAELMK